MKKTCNFHKILTRKLGLFCCVFFLFFSHAKGHASIQNCDAFFSPDRAKENIKGLVVLGHGLNLRPDRMDSIASFLREAGYAVFRVGFRGHCKDAEAYKNISLQDWLHEGERHKKFAEDFRQKYQKEVFLIAFSFSAAIYEAVHFPAKKKIYLAPALRPHAWYSLVRMLRYLPVNFSFPSSNLPEYRANETTSLASFRAMDDLLQLESVKNFGQDPTPTLVLVEEKDELVSFSALANGITQLSRSHWRMEKISTEACELKQCFHHLVIDKESLGSAEWERMKQKILSFLL